jgi:hypothetical protein
VPLPTRNAQNRSAAQDPETKSWFGATATWARHAPALLWMLPVGSLANSSTPPPAKIAEVMQ